MIGRPRGTLGSLVLLAAAGLVAAGVWLAWPRAAPPAEVEPPPPPVPSPPPPPVPSPPPPAVPSPALARQTLDRLEEFRTGTAERTLALGSAEITSVMRFALPGHLLTGVSDPEVRLAGGRLTLSARVAIGAFTELAALGPVMGLLPDTVPVLLEGVFTRFAPQSLAFRVDRLEAAEIPLPERLVPEVLGALGHTRPGGMPGDALYVPLPPGIDSVYLVRDSLVLSAGR
ncbi:MAG: hypothetical protein OXI46_02020 [Gemmatimonadota bacterium]|nr:hypothetical protein [Gemmatimonadota bacterium]